MGGQAHCLTSALHCSEQGRGCGRSITTFGVRATTLVYSYMHDLLLLLLHAGEGTATTARGSNGTQPSGSIGSSQQQGANTQRRQRPANPSLWSWLDVSPHSSYEEF